MKLKYIFFLPFLAMFVAGCYKPKSNEKPFTAPTGTFTGTFTRLHYVPATSKHDTLTTNISLSMDLATGYQINGDTTIHAGSHGNYVVTADYIGFDDFTYTGTALPAKPHLIGTYSYTFNGTTLQMQQTYSDTLGFFYNLTKN